jgi:hypothetical protein
VLRNIGLSGLFLFRLSNPNISEWMKNVNISDAKGIHTYYADRILNITRNINVKTIVWQDVWDEKVQVRVRSSR